MRTEDTTATARDTWSEGKGHGTRTPASGSHSLWPEGTSVCQLLLWDRLLGSTQADRRDSHSRTWELPGAVAGTSWVGPRWGWSGA